MSRTYQTAEAEQAAAEQWVQRLRTGDEQALEWLFSQYYRYLVVSSYNILQDDARAKDLVQDVFFKLWNQRASLTDITNVKAYLRRAVVNKSIDEVRRNKRISLRDEWHEDTSRGTTIGADDELAAQDLKTVIHAAIERLPERCRLIFSLSRFEQLPQKEIAEQLGVSIKTVENQMTKALKLIRVAVERYQALWVLGYTSYTLCMMGVSTISFVL
ncbi:MAG: RNA polymerase sigma-70 factor [Bacteroidota bacterium]